MGTYYAMYSSHMHCPVPAMKHQWVYFVCDVICDLLIVLLCCNLTPDLALQCAY